MDSRFDEYFFTMAKETGGIDGLLNTFFSFLQRRTDFFYESDPGDKMGFPPGVAQKMLAKQFHRYQQEHFKKHPQKSIEDYQSKVAAQKEKIQHDSIQHASEPEPISVPQQTFKPQQAQHDFNTYNGGVNDNYQWSQSSNDVSLQVKIPPGTTKKDLNVTITSTDLIVKHRNSVLLEGKFYDRVRWDDSVWTIEDGQVLNLTLEKATENIWKTVLKGDPEIDATKVDNSKSLESFDGETQGALRKIMYEQQRKQMGLPSTDEEKQYDVLKKAWDAEGSPFKGTPFDPSKLNLGGQQMNL